MATKEVISPPGVTPDTEYNPLRDGIVVQWRNCGGGGGNNGAVHWFG